MRDGLGDLHPSRAVARRMLELEGELERARAYRRRHSKSPDTTGRWGLEQPSAPQQEEGWFITYLDMMTLLLVVMIVMLAFSGSLGDRAGSVQPIEHVAAAVAEPPDVATPAAGASRSVASQATVPATIAPDETGSPPVTPSAEPAQSPTPTGSGLLPGGTGLLPGHAGVADASAPSGPHPESTGTGVTPPVMSHPADVGPLPRDAQVITGKTAMPFAATATAELYPGWGAADLAASFIGPPRPATASATADDTAPTAETVAAEDDPPSEGESLAAGLSLGELGSDVEVVVNERSVSFRVNSEILFDTSQADLSRSGLSVLRRIVGVLSDTSHEVTVEGHTDSVPVRRNVRYPSNWELSSARAGGVVRYLQANGIDRTRLKAVGYADTRPIADNHTPDGRASNRRVELVIEKRD